MGLKPISDSLYILTYVGFTSKFSFFLHTYKHNYVKYEQQETNSNNGRVTRSNQSTERKITQKSHIGKTKIVNILNA